MPKTHKVNFLKSGKIIEVEEGKPILPVALDGDLPLEYSCIQGACASCRVVIKSGETEYLDEPLGLFEDEVEQGYVLICIATPKSDVDIDA